MRVIASSPRAVVVYNPNLRERRRVPPGMAVSFATIRAGEDGVAQPQSRVFEGPFKKTFSGFARGETSGQGRVLIPQT
jgi:hypothetical protein